MRDPGAGAEPPGLIEEIDRAHAERLDAVDVLVERLAEMGVQPAIVALGEFGRSVHHPLRHGERRAGRKRDADHRARFDIVIEAQHPLAVLEDRLRILHDRVGLQAPVLLGNAHGSARDRHAQPKLRRLFNLDVDRVRQGSGERDCDDRPRSCSPTASVRRAPSGSRCAGPRESCGPRRAPSKRARE